MHPLGLVVPDILRRLAELLQLDAGALTRKLIQVAFIWLFAWAGIRIIRLVARRIEAAVDDGDVTTLSEAEQRGQTISQLLRSVGRVFFVALALLLTLNTFVDIGPILAGAGILGLAVSFGAQSLVKDVISGFFYLAEGQFAVGDVIEVAGKSGAVERMTLRVVMLRDLNGALHIIPNGQVTTVTNMTRKWARAVVDVGVAYGTDVDRAIDILRDEAVRLARDAEWKPQFDGDPEVVGVTDLGDSQVTIRTLLRTLPGKQWGVGREFRRRIKRRLDQEGIEIPFPQRTMHVRVSDGPSAEAARALGVANASAPTGSPLPPPPRATD